MNKFSLVIRQVVDGKYETKFIELETDKNINSKGVRTFEINRYLKSNKYNQYCLCFDCTLGPLDCTKMADISKKMIYDYPFIIEGYQIQDMYNDFSQINYKDNDFSTCEFERASRCNDLRIEKFVVSKCKNFKGIKRY